MRRTIDAQLVDRMELTGEVCAFTFEAVGASFGALDAGSHIDVHLGGDLVRSYSLTDWDEAGRWVSVAVKAEPDGRGGSLAMHQLSVGGLVRIGGPRNNFPLTVSEHPIVLLGGGIGITPLYAMAKALRRLRRSFDIRYFVRAREMAAFDAQLRKLELGERYQLHCDDVDGLPDMRQIIAQRPAATHYYVCGPEVLLNAIQKASDELQRGTIFFERFAAVPSRSAGRNRSFEIVLDSSGETLEVPSDSSILQVLRAAGHDVDYSCGEGTCGTCILDVLGGDIDHRDSILTDEEKSAGDCICACVSRAASPRLILDL
jgi:vanillate O-demethylase ferredoxin subunit